MNIGAKIKELRGKLGLSQSAFSKETGIPLDSLKKYEGEKTAPGSDALAGMARLGANLNWLLDPNSAGPAVLNSATNRISEDAGSYAAIPLIDVHAAAGNGVVVDSERVIDVLHFKHEWIHNELHVNASDLRLLFVDGESMEPFLRAGDIILVNLTDNTPKRDAIYVLRLEDALLVKRLQRLPNRRIRVTSDKPAYEPFDLSTDEMDGVAIIGRVVWMGRRI